jgi:ATP-binding cassette subfamily F protein 3
VIRNLLAAFLFQGDTVDKRVDMLSGGEKSRLVLATILARPVSPRYCLSMGVALGGIG